MPNPLDDLPDPVPERRPFEDLEDIPVLNDSEESILEDAPAPKAPPAPTPAAAAPPPAAPPPVSGTRRVLPGRVSSSGTGRRIVPPGATRQPVPPPPARRAPSDSEIQRAMSTAGADESDAFPQEEAATGPQRLETDWDENDVYTFAHSGIRMSKGPVPILFVLAMLVVLAWGGLYGYFYWNGDRPIPSLAEVEGLFGSKK